MEKVTGSTFVDVRQLPEIFEGLKFNLDKMRPIGRRSFRVKYQTQSAE